MSALRRDCVIAGGGPAGVMLGYLLARAGLTVTVLEKHVDFFRDFRGDTIHPSTVTLLGELGLRDAFLSLPLSHITTLDVVIDSRRMTMVDFGALPRPDNFLAFAPQWDFLTFLCAEGAAYPGFEVLMGAEVTGLITEGDRVSGVTVVGPEGEAEIRAALTVAADGRASTVRATAGLVPEELGVPIDVLWYRLPKPSAPPPVTLAYVDSTGFVLTIDRGDYYQGGFVIPKGGFKALQARGLQALRSDLARIAPPIAEVVDSLTDWEQVKLLSVQLDRLPRWYRDGLMCIGDAAHAMSPVGGVGINYAIQDAVALAREVAPVLGAGRVPESVLAAVQKRRVRPVLRMQRIQRFAHSRISRATLHHRPAIPAPARLLLRVFQPLVRRGMARLIGRGFLPEHVRGG